MYRYQCRWDSNPVYPQGSCLLKTPGHLHQNNTTRKVACCLHKSGNSLPMSWWNCQAVSSNGPRTAPRGTPHGTDIGKDLSLPIHTSCGSPDKYDLSYTPNLRVNLLSRLVWSILSKAVKSNMVSTTTRPRLTAQRISLYTFSKTVSLEWCCRYADWNWLCRCLQYAVVCDHEVALQQHAQSLPIQMSYLKPVWNR